MALNKERIYGYAKAYLESVTTLLKDKSEEAMLLALKMEEEAMKEKSEEAEGDRRIGDENLMRSAR